LSDIGAGYLAALTRARSVMAVAFARAGSSVSQLELKLEDLEE
jgi:hypothetical protein